MKNVKIFAMVFSFIFTIATVYATTIQYEYTYAYQIIDTECVPIECVLEPTPLVCPLPGPFYIDQLCEIATPVVYTPI